MPAAAAMAIRDPATAPPCWLTWLTVMCPKRQPGCTTGWTEIMTSTQPTQRLARIGVDVGGTFTDLVLYDPSRQLALTGKLLTTPEDPSIAIINGIKRILSEA